MSYKNLETSQEFKDLTTTPLSAAALYMFGQVFENKQTFPGIEYPSNTTFQKENFQELINAGLIENDVLTDKGQQLVKALMNMQKAQFALVLNEVAFFFDPNKIVVTKVVTIDHKHDIHYGYKSLEIMAAIGAIKYLNTDMESKDTKLQDQVISAIEVTKIFKEHDSISCQIIKNGELLYNKVWIEGDDSVIVFDPEKSLLTEKAGREIIKEILKLIQFGEEFNFNSKIDNRKSSF